MQREIAFNLEGERKWHNFYADNVTPNLNYPKVPLFYFLDEAARENPSNIALSFYGKEINYSEYKNLTDRFASALQKEGVQKGDKVMILAANCTQNIIAFYGTMKAGAVPVLLNPLYTSEELEYFFKDSSPRIVFCLDSFYEKVSKAAKATPQIEKIITTNISDYFSPLTRFFARLTRKVEVVKCENSIDFNDFINVSPDYQEILINPLEDAAVIVYTGGTTGDPKGVVLTHYNLVSDTWAIKEWLANNPPDSFMLVIPMFHIYGCGPVLNWPCFLRAKLVILPKFHTEETVKIIRKHKIEGFFGVPAIYLAIIKHFKENPKAEKLSSVKFCSSGSAPIASYAWQRVAEIFPNAALTEAYGLSETTGPYMIDPIVKKYEKKFGSVGVPFPNTDVRIVDPKTNEELPPGEKGEVVVKGCTIFKEYLNKPEKTKEAFRDGWFCTKDIGIMDEKGVFYLEGRMDDMINVRGEKVWPREIEKVLEENSKVKEVAVVGIKDDFYGERVKAFVVLEAGANITENELILFCEERLTKYKAPREIEFLTELPKSNLGKTLHYKLRTK
ncbi:AMP-binding protein [bacterium]|nr:AMP-binding protein [bacterium]